MGVVIGVVVGYALGTRAGEDGWTEFRDAWKVIATSEEVRDMATGGFSVARGLVGRSSERLADALGGSGGTSSLRPVA